MKGPLGVACAFQIEAALDACLLDDTAFQNGPGYWKAMTDPFPTL